MYLKSTGRVKSLLPQPCGENKGSIVMHNRLSTILGIIYFKSLFDSSRHGFVFTSIRMVFICSSKMKSYPRSSNVNFYDKNLPFTDFIESIICFFIVSLNVFSSSSWLLPSTCGHSGFAAMCSNTRWIETMLPSSNFPYSSPFF